MMYLRTATVLLGASVAIACAENTTPAPTGPQLRLGQSTAAACDAAADRAVKSQQSALFPKPYLATVQTRWAAVESACSAAANGADIANGQLLEYVSYILSLYPANVSIPRGGTADTRETNFLLHLDAIYPYVGYSAPGLPSANGPLDFVGGLGVISGTGTTREITTGDGDAALTLGVQNLTGDTRAHMFAIYPAPAACNTGNLQHVGPCYEVASFPAASVAWNPLIKVGVCTEVHTGETESIVANAPALGHVTGGYTEIAGNLPYPSTCGTHVVDNTGAWNGGLGGIVTRLAWLGKQVLLPSVAYATHSGLGGVGSTLSPWGAVDLLVFNAPVDTSAGRNTFGAFPSPPSTGSWDGSSFATSPGSIKVEASLGQYTNPIIVMSQAGGACSGCGGLLLQGNLFSASDSLATRGKYEISFVALEEAPAVKEAPFMLRDNAGNEIVRLSFATVGSVNQVILNYDRSTGAGTVVGSWTRHVPKTFVFTIDLTNKTVALNVDGSPVAVPGAYSNTSAVNLARIVFDARGIDSGVMGWDNIRVQRLSDH